jgi:predicted nucleotide-binding protein (sugar kinase/HSP70/actin superfamily)
MILDAFDAIPVNRTNKVRVGIVGEIYVKYSPLGNNNLEAFLLREGAQVVVPGLIGFFMYCVYNNMMDFRLYRLKRLLYPFLKLVYDYMLNKQRKIANLIRKHGRFMPSSLFSHTVTRVKKYISLGAKMGEGWLLPAEMLELADSGVNNIVCTQPFGCLPNHIFGKGMMKPLKADNPDINIVAIDYDSGASPVNQENRLKLMLSNALRAGEEQRRAAENSIFAGAL